MAQIQANQPSSFDALKECVVPFAKTAFVCNVLYYSVATVASGFFGSQNVEPPINAIFVPTALLAMGKIVVDMTNLFHGFSSAIKETLNIYIPIALFTFLFDTPENMGYNVLHYSFLYFLSSMFMQDSVMGRAVSMIKRDIQVVQAGDGRQNQAGMVS